MTAEEAYAALTQFLATNPPIDVATVAKPANNEIAQEARYLTLASSAETFFRRITTEAVLGAEAPDLRQLDLTYKPDPGTVEWAKLDDVDAVRLAVENYQQLARLSPFNPGDERYKTRLLFWVANRARDDVRASFFRAFSASAELKRKRGAILVNREGAFSRVEGQLFMFDENVDCVVFDEYLFVLRRNDYRRIFDQFEQIRLAARNAANTLHGRVPIANLQEFADACVAQPAMADKLIAVQGRDYFSHLTYEMLEPVIEEFQLDIPVERRNGRPHLVFRAGPAVRWQILRLVDDDFLRSSMTDHHYEVNSKTAKD